MPEQFTHQTFWYFMRNYCPQYSSRAILPTIWLNHWNSTWLKLSTKFIFLEMVLHCESMVHREELRFCFQNFVARKKLSAANFLSPIRYSCTNRYSCFILFLHFFSGIGQLPCLLLSVLPFSLPIHYTWE